LREKTRALIAFTDAARRAPARLPLGVAGRHHSEHVDRTGRG
jgi:hypothetical protein